MSRGSEGCPPVNLPTSNNVIKKFEKSKKSLKEEKGRLFTKSNKNHKMCKTINMSCIECVEEERSRQREIESVKIQLELLQLQMEMERWRVFKPVIEAVEELAYDGDIEENSEEEEMEIEDSNEEDQRKVTNDFPNREKINNNFTPEDINVAIMNTGGLKSKALSVSNMCNILDSTSATSFNQAKNVRNNSQGGQAAGGNETRNFGHPHGGSSGTGSMNYGPRPGLISQCSSGTQDPATSQIPADNHQLFTQPPPAVITPFNRQVPGPYGGQGPYQHPQTPGANIGHVDARETGQGIPPSAAGWNNVLVNCKAFNFRYFYTQYVPYVA